MEATSVPGVGLVPVPRRTFAADEAILAGRRFAARFPLRAVTVPVLPDSRSPPGGDGGDESITVSGAVAVLDSVSGGFGDSCTAGGLGNSRSIGFGPAGGVSAFRLARAVGARGVAVSFLSSTAGSEVRLTRKRVSRGAAEGRTRHEITEIVARWIRNDATKQNVNLCSEG